MLQPRLFSLPMRRLLQASLKKSNVPSLLTLMVMVLAVLLPNTLKATGPSSIRVEMIPIAINKQGQILCKTRYESNAMGSYSAVPVHYGFCVILEDSVIRFNGKVIEPGDDEEQTWEQIHYWDQIFEAPTNPGQLATIVEVVLDNKYEFEACNAQAYFKGKTLSKSAFEANNAIDLDRQPQQAFDGTKSVSYYDNQQLNVLYDFGRVVVLHNQGSEDCSATCHGAKFNYKHYIPSYPEEDQTDIFFTSRVTGILFLKP